MANFYNNLIKYANPAAGDCNWDFDYHRSNYINAIMLSQLKQANYIKTGLIPSIGTGLNIDYTAGVAVVDEVEFIISASSVACVAAPISGVEFNCVYVDDAGAIQVTQDDPNESFAAIAIVDTDDTAIVRLMDARQTRYSVKDIIWQSLESANFSLELAKGYPVDTSTIAITATLPSTPIAGDMFSIKDYSETFDKNSLIFGMNGSLIDGKDSYQLTSKGFAGTFVYIDTTIGWAVVSDANRQQPTFNHIIDGDFNFWYEGTSQTAGGYGSHTMWRNDIVTATQTHTRQAFPLGHTYVPGNPDYYSRTVVVSGSTSGSHVFKEQRLEDVTKLSGKLINISFWARASATKNLSISFLQVFGTGGSPSGGIITYVDKVTLTTSWAKHTATIAVPSVSGKTLGTDLNDFLSIRLWFDAGSSYDAQTDSLGNQSGTFDIARVRLVEGAIDGDSINEDYAKTLSRIQRYFFQSELFGGQISTTGGAVYCQLPPLRNTPLITGVTSVYIEDVGFASGVSVINAINTTSRYARVQVGFTAAGSGTYPIATGAATFDARL